MTIINWEELFQKEKFFNIPMMPLSDVENILKKLGFEEIEEYDSNGWEIDFWWEWEHHKYGKWMFSGSLWSGNFNFKKL